MTCRMHGSIVHLACEGKWPTVNGGDGGPQTFVPDLRTADPEVIVGEFGVAYHRLHHCGLPKAHGSAPRRRPSSWPSASVAFCTVLPLALTSGGRQDPHAGVCLRC